MAKTKKTYLKGLGDIFVKAQKAANVGLIFDEAEDLALYAPVASGDVSANTVYVDQGSQSAKVVATASGDGAEITPADPVDLSAYEDKILQVRYYAQSNGVMLVKVNESSNSQTFSADMVSGGWKSATIDLSNPIASTGTVDWEAIDSIEITFTAANTVYVDGIYLFNSYSDIERVMDVRIGCLEDISLSSDFEEIELRCSDNELEQTDIVARNITISSTFKDMDPHGLQLVSTGKVTTDSVTKQVQENSTVPASGPYTITPAEAANLKVGNGYGVWVQYADTLEVLQSADSDDVIPARYFYLNPTTGELTFNAADAGKSVVITYNVVTTDGVTLEVSSDDEQLEFSIQFKVKGSNGKQGLFAAPRVKSTSFNLNPEKADFWTTDFEGALLKDPVTGKLYDFHVTNA